MISFGSEGSLRVKKSHIGTHLQRVKGGLGSEKVEVSRVQWLLKQIIIIRSSNVGMCYVVGHVPPFCFMDLGGDRFVSTQ